MRGLVCAIAVLIGAAGMAKAAVMQYAVSGAFTDGEALTGSFFLDNAATLPGSMFGSTLTIGQRGQYTRFIGAAVPPGAAPNSWLDIQFLGTGILSLQVPASYDLSLGRVYGIRNGALLTGALYANAPNDLLLANATIAALPEPPSSAVLGAGVILSAACLSRRRVAQAQARRSFKAS